MIALALVLALAVQSHALTGRVIDVTGRAIPGATVELSGHGVTADAVSDPTGRFHIGNLADGTYEVTVSLAGFRPQTLTALVDSTSRPELIVRLTTGILSEVLWSVPEPADAYRTAVAIAHVRIERTRPYGPCGDAPVVTAHHEVSVLRVFKGKLPAAISLLQEAAGRCREGWRWREGIEPPYRTGEEYVVFLAERAGAFGRLAGPSLAFPVRGNSVILQGFAGVEGSVGIDEFRDLLARLAGRERPGAAGD